MGIFDNVKKSSQFQKYIIFFGEASIVGVFYGKFVLVNGCV